MVAFAPMKIRITLLTVIKLSSLAGVGALAACGAHGQVRVDSPVLPYQAPDISDITGIDDDDAGSGSGSAEAGK